MRDSFAGNCKMKTTVALLLLGLMISAFSQDANRLSVNDKKLPVGSDDMRAIEAALKSSLPAARNATVCLELAQGSGSGVIISADGLILTAAHVTGGVGKDITAILADGRKIKCESLGLDSETDCAMARLSEKGPYSFVEVDRADLTKLGDWVFPWAIREDMTRSAARVSGSVGLSRSRTPLGRVTALSSAGIPAVRCLTCEVA
jgi:hypothetical protein